VYLISPEGSIEAFEADIGDASGLPPDASAARPAA
jgi:hypothetical protein